jgi:ABC-type amino acid transport substrate-binding protein
VTVLTKAQRKYPDATFKLAEGYVPPKDQQWNLKYLVRKRDKTLIQFINEGVKQLHESGKIKEIVESYDVPYYAPF